MTMCDGVGQAVGLRTFHWGCSGCYSLGQVPGDRRATEVFASHGCAATDSDLQQPILRQAVQDCEHDDIAVLVPVAQLRK